MTQLAPIEGGFKRRYEARSAHEGTELKAWSSSNWLLLQRYHPRRRGARTTGNRRYAWEASP